MDVLEIKKSLRIQQICEGIMLGIMVGSFCGLVIVSDVFIFAVGPEAIDPVIACFCNECSQCILKCPHDNELRTIFRAMTADNTVENGDLVLLDALKPSEAGQVKACAEEYCTAVPACAPPAVENVVRHLKDCLGEDEMLARRLETHERLNNFKKEGTICGKIPETSVLGGRLWRQGNTLKAGCGTAVALVY